MDIERDYPGERSPKGYGRRLQLVLSAEYEGVTRTVFLIVHDAQRAEDIAQNTFTQLLVHLNKISKYDRPDAWVRRVAIRARCGTYAASGSARR